MTDRRKRFVRVSTVAITLIAFLLPHWIGTPTTLPAIALGSEKLLYLERGFAIFGVLLFVLTVLVRGWDGVLPNSLSGRGAGWPDAVDETERSIGALQVRMDALQAQLNSIKRYLGLDS